MQTISDEYMREMLGKTRAYTVCILRPGPRMKEPGVEKIIWEHGRRNFVLRAEGQLAIVCPVSDGGDVAGVGILNATVDQVDALLRDDPAVKAEVLVYELHATRSFPGDALPG